MGVPDNLDNSNENLFIYRLKIRQYEKINMNEKLKNRIISETVKFLGKTDKFEIKSDPNNLLEFIGKWLENDLTEQEIEKFCNITRDFFVTRSVERNRTLLFLNQKDAGNFFLIHLRDYQDIIDSKFVRFFIPGFGAFMILRIFMFTRIDERYYVYFWEKVRSKILQKFFNIENEHYDYSELVKISCKIENLKAILTLSPDMFQDLIKREKINFDKNKRELTIDGLVITVNSLRVNEKSFKSFSWLSLSKII